MLKTLNKHNEMNRISLFFTAVWIVYILLSPMYVFSKGLPQPADYIIFAFGFPALIIMMINYRGNLSQVFIYGLLFSLLTIIINLINFTFFLDDRLIKHSLYYIFNFSVFLFSLIIFKQNPEKITKLTYYAIAITICFEFLYAPILGDIQAGRNAGSFNNPNQLAYWSLLNIALIIVLKHGKQLSVLDFILFALCIYLQSIALSKAGIIISVFMLILIFFLPNQSKIIRIFMCMGALIFIVFQVFEPEILLRKIEHVDQISKIAMRLENIGEEGDDTAAGRGYMRLVNYPYYLFFGAGEGAYFRFGIGAQEIHSGIATMIFSYGFIGFFLFSWFIFKIYKKLPIIYLILLGFIVLYSLTHQGFRFTYFWIFLSICYSRIYVDLQQRNIKNSEATQANLHLE